MRKPPSDLAGSRDFVERVQGLPRSAADDLPLRRELVILLSLNTPSPNSSVHPEPSVRGGVGPAMTPPSLDSQLPLYLPRYSNRALKNTVHVLEALCDEEGVS
jgi:hypothetical protein